MGINVTETDHQRKKLTTKRALKTTSTVAHAPRVSLGARRLPNSTVSHASEEGERPNKGVTVRAKMVPSKVDSGEGSRDPTTTGENIPYQAELKKVSPVVMSEEYGKVLHDRAEQSIAHNYSALPDHEMHLNGGQTHSELVDEFDSVLTLNEPKRVVPTVRLCSETLFSNTRELNKSGLPLGFLWTPFGQIEGVSQIWREPVRCKECSAFVAGPNGGNDILSGKETWKCKICAYAKNGSGEMSLRAKESPSLYPELTSDVVEYIHGDGLRTEKADNAVPGIVLLVDENLEAEEARWLRQVLTDLFINPLLEKRRIALLTFSSTPSAVIFDSTQPMPTLEVVMPEKLNRMTAEQKEKYFIEMPGGAGKDKQETWIENLEAAICSRSPPFERSGSSGKASSDGGATPRRYVRRNRQTEERCLDMAMKSAIALCKGTLKTGHTRVLSIITGPPSASEHTLETLRTTNVPNKEEAMKTASKESEYVEVGDEAGMQQVALDFLIFGCGDTFSAPLLMRTARRSHGGVALSSPHGYSSTEALYRAIVTLATRPCSLGTVISVRTSPDVSVCRVIGPALPTATPNIYVLPGDDPSAGFSVMVQSNATSSKLAILQLASKNSQRTRVITISLPLTSDIGTFIASIDPEASAVLISKICIVTRSGVFDERRCQKSMDLSCQHILSWLNGMTHANTDHPQVPPPSIPLDVVRLLFEVRRGIIVGTQIQRDDGCTLRSYFLRTEAQIAALMMAPRVFYTVANQAQTSVQIEECAADISYLKSDTVVLVDAGVNVFIWKGSDAKNADEIERSIREVVDGRDWVQLWVIDQGSEMEKLLWVYLKDRDEGDSDRPGFWSRFTKPKGESLEDVTNMSFPKYCIAIVPNFNFDMFSMV